MFTTATAIMKLTTDRKILEKKDRQRTGMIRDARCNILLSNIKKKSRIFCLIFHHPLFTK